MSEKSCPVCGNWTHEEFPLQEILAARSALSFRIKTKQYMQINELTGLGCSMVGEEWKEQLAILDKFIGGLS